MVEVYSAQGRELARSADPNIPELKYLDPDAAFAQESAQGKELTRIQPVGAGDIIRGIVPVYAASTPGYVNGILPSAITYRRAWCHGSRRYPQHSRSTSSLSSTKSP